MRKLSKLGVLGKGSFSCVYLVEDTATKEVSFSGILGGQGQPGSYLENIRGLASEFLFKNLTIEICVEKSCGP